MSKDKTTEPLSPAFLLQSEAVQAATSIDAATGTPTYKDITHATLLPEGLTVEHVEQSVNHLAHVAVVVAHATAAKASEAAKTNPDLKRVVGTFPGPGGSTLDVSWTRQQKVAGKPYDGVVSVGWDGLGKPGDGLFQSVRMAAREMAAGLSDAPTT